jgi:hypothetical protein
MANEIDHFGSGWTDQETGITYNASGEPINAPDTGGSSHFDPSGQLITAGGEKVDMSAYAPITSPENYPGGFWGYYQHLVDTGQVNNDTQGLGGVGGFIRSHGYMVPLALMSGGLALEAAGGLGALGTSAELAGPTYGELGITGVEGGFAGPTYGEMGYTGLNQQAAINAANAAQGTSFADALKTANQVKQGVSTASSLAKLLSPTSSLGAGSALSGAMQNFAKGQTGVGSAIPGIIRGNQNPFLQTAQQPIRSTSLDLAQLANLLKQG